MPDTRHNRDFRSRDDRGSVALDAAIVAPALILLIMLAILVGRTSAAASAVADAAHDSARAASLSRTASDANRSANQAADASLASAGSSCTSHRVEVNTGGFTVPVGQPATVTVTLSCTVSYADLVAIPGMPGSKTLTTSFISPLDQFRARS
ncbi:TadE/TadG family type IV pilus assembly protein [Micromonospora sp. DT4]|uniref:TadE/TadG family type IV pilus assembly protein n=1 Tax=Micromonospora sp. DT4 TaxID=3393438 RepID=UPI003CEACC7A